MQHENHQVVVVCDCTAPHTLMHCPDHAARTYRGSQMMRRGGPQCGSTQASAVVVRQASWWWGASPIAGWQWHWTPGMHPEKTEEERLPHLRPPLPRHCLPHPPLSQPRPLQPRRQHPHQTQTQRQRQRQTQTQTQRQRQRLRPRHGRGRANLRCCPASTRRRPRS